MDNSAKFKRIDAILNSLSDKIFIIDRDGFFIDFFAREEDDLAIPKEKIVGSSIFDIFQKDEASRHLRIIRNVLLSGEMESFEYLLPREGLQYFYEAIVSKLNENEVISIVRDISKRIQTENDLKESKKRFKDLADLLPEVVFETDFAMIITYGNKRAFELFGYNQEDFEKGILCVDLIIPEEREKGRENIMRKFKGEYEVFSEYSGLKKDGTTFPMLLHSNPYFRDGKPAGIRGIIVDMTAQKRIDESISRAQKLDSLGFLAGGIAHDFNNLISGLFGSVEVAQNEIKKRSYDNAAEALEKSITAFEKAKNLAHQLLTFAKGGIPNKKLCDIKKTVSDSVNFALSGSNISPKFDFADDLSLSNYDPNQIGQVIENIIINAKQAMSDKGTISIKGENVIVGENSALVLMPGRYIKISIKDSGIGIPAEDFQKIFDPFFTTKKCGSGLGLATSWSIIKRHDGILDLESEVGKGSTFYIYIPSFDGAIEQIKSKEIAEFSGKEKILVMDDEFLIREVAGKILIDSGFRVEKAATGEEALLMYKQANTADDPFDVVILDLTVPGGMGGKETLDKLKEFDSNVNAIASSGYSEDAIISSPQDFGFSAALPKPYLKETFAEIIREVISRAKSNKNNV